MFICMMCIIRLYMDYLYFDDAKYWDMHKCVHVIRKTMRHVKSNNEDAFNLDTSPIFIHIWYYILIDV
jgi:hypothetical protein